MSLVKSIPLSDEIVYVYCIAQSPNRDIVMNYTTDPHHAVSLISILSTDGEIIRTFNPSLFETFPSLWRPVSFAITEDGDIFVVDPDYGRIFLLNSQLTEYQIVSNKNYEHRRPMSIIYIKEKQQLLVEGCVEYVWKMRGNGLERVETHYVLHLSPCKSEKKTDWHFISRKANPGSGEDPEVVF